jgi:copper chaperone CopZ
MSSVTYSVPNITCEHCVRTIQTELSEVDGVTRVVASEATKRLEVEYSPPASEERIEALLAEIDYPAVKV